MGCEIVYYRHYYYCFLHECVNVFDIAQILYRFVAIAGFAIESEFNTKTLSHLILKYIIEII